MLSTTAIPGYIPSKGSTSSCTSPLSLPIRTPAPQKTPFSDTLRMQFHLGLESFLREISSSVKVELRNHRAGAVTKRKGFLNLPHQSPPSGPAVEACPRLQRATGSSLHENGSAHQGARIHPDNGRFQNPDRNQSGSFFFQDCFLLQTRCAKVFRPIPRQSF